MFVMYKQATIRLEQVTIESVIIKSDKMHITLVGSPKGELLLCEMQTMTCLEYPVRVAITNEPHEVVV